MANSQKKIAIIVPNEEEREAIQEKLVTFSEIVLELLPSPEEFQRLARKEDYAGLVVDLKSLIKKSTSDKSLYSELSNIYPTLKFRKNPGSDDITGIINDEENLAGEELLERFVKDIVTEFKERRLRKDPRFEIFAPVQFGASEGANLTMKSANTHNLSESGCYIMCPEEIEELPQSIELIFPTSQLSKPLIATPLWSLGWSKSGDLPAGMGVRFENLTEDDKKEIRKLILRHRHRLLKPE